MSGFHGQTPRVEQVYDLGGELGRGSFSTVYEGVHKVTKEKVALKVIPSRNYRHNERAKQLLRTEVSVMSKIRRLGHPHLMVHKHTFEDQEKIVMVLEYLSGGELFDRIVARGHYSEQDASKLIRVIVEALQAIHSVGILHRDLKPENCIYASSSEDSLKITDFGLAAICGEGVERLQDRHLVGTPGYIAPEILTGYSYSAASDIWAAGVILFILLSGSPPFYGRKHPEVFEKIKLGKWGFVGRNWATVSESAKDLVRKMLAQRPEDRITAEGVLEHPFVKEYSTISSTHMPDTLAELKRYNARQKFKAAAMVCIASSRLTRFVMSSKPQSDRLESLVDSSLFTPEELGRIKAEFSAQASRGQNTIDFAGFSEIMTRLELSHLPLDRIFAVFDADNSGRLDYKEFLLGVSKLRLKGEQAIKFCFEVFDEDKSGTITRDELTKVLVHTRRRSREQMNPSQSSSTGGSASASVSSSGNGHSASPPPTQTGPLIVAHDDGMETELVAEQTGAAAMSIDQPMPIEKLDVRFMSMDPDAYEVAEGIAEIFDSLDENGDNQITLDEFLSGARRHPELLDLFLEGPEAQRRKSQEGKGLEATMELSST